jgi:hypothetical protein
VYAEPALAPETVWLGEETPEQPIVAARQTAQGLAVEMKLPSDKDPWLWVVRARTGDGWKTAIVPGHNKRHHVQLVNHHSATEAVVSAVSRLGREGPAARADIEKHD